MWWALRISQAPSWLVNIIYVLTSLNLDRNADIEEPNDENYSPLQEAAREGHREVVELLLDRGANVNSKIEDSVETALTLAASGGYL